MRPFHKSRKARRSLPAVVRARFDAAITNTDNARHWANAGDRHPESLLHLVMALNADSAPIRQLGGMVPMPPPAGIPGLPMPRAHPLSWLGRSVALYIDQDDFWAEAAKAKDPARFVERNPHRLPLALHVEVRNPLQLVLFLTALRGMVETSAPQLTRWETLRHAGRPYVRISVAAPEPPTTQPAAQRGEDWWRKLAIYYASTPDSLVLTLNEALLKRALDRAAARQRAATQPAAPPPPAPEPAPSRRRPDRPWLGESLALQVDRRALQVIEGLFAEEYEQAMQAQSWSNIPILNEWRRLFPGRDPVALHERLWGIRLVCPGEGKYVWNPKWRTMESTVYGHPGQPRSGPKVARPLTNVTFGNFGLTFENGGLRARVELERSGPAGREH